MKESKYFHVKRAILTSFLFMTLGYLSEMFLLSHYEDKMQLIPIVTIALSLIFLSSLLINKNKSTIYLFKGSLILNLISGFLGFILHMKSNYEFELEMKPSEKSWNLILESFSGALPALAPFSLVVLSIIGYSYLTTLKIES